MVETNLASPLDHSDQDDPLEHGNDILSESESESGSTISNFEILSDQEIDEMDIELDEETRNIDFSVPDIKANPPKWTADLQSFTVPPFCFTSGPRLPDSFNNTSKPINYFKFFFTDEVIEDIVRFTNQYAQIQNAKKRITNQNYYDKEWAFDGSDNVSTDEMRAYIGCCIILSINPAH